MIIDLVTGTTANDIKNAIDENKNAIVAAITNKYDEDATLVEVKDLRTIDGVTNSSAGIAIRNKFNEIDEKLNNLGYDLGDDTAIKNKFDEIDEKFNSIQDNLGDLTTILDQINGEVV